MDITIKGLKNSFEYAFDARQASMCEANAIVDLYHNIHYTTEQLSTLGERGQPAETFNIIKMFARQLVGYYSSVVTSTMAVPESPEDTQGATLLNDIVQYNDNISNWKVEGNEVKLYGILTGLMCVHVRPKYVYDKQGNIKKDKFGTPIVTIDKSYVPWDEVVPDPKAKEIDYSDARFTHRYSWLSMQEVKAKFGHVPNSLIAFDQMSLVNSTNLTFSTDVPFNKSYKNLEEYLVVHSIIKDANNDTYSIYWSGDSIISKTKLTRNSKSEYKIVKVQNDGANYYGVFREAKESQLAIDQALIQLQLLVNTNRILYTEGSIGATDKEIQEFTKSFNRVNSVTKVVNLKGVRIEKLTAEVREQYLIIDKALNRVQRILGINDSFLGMAYASDSGRKVSMQRGATIMGLSYLTDRISLLYKLVGEEELDLITELYTASQTLRLGTMDKGRWIEVNKPLINPKTKKPYYEYTAKGKEILNTPESDIRTIDVTYSTVAVSRHADEEKNQQLIETVLNGNAGQFLMQTDPAAYAEAVAESIELVKTASSNKIADMFKAASDRLKEQNSPQRQFGANQLGGQPSNAQQVQTVNEG